MAGRVVVLLVDVDSRGNIEHAVAYSDLTDRHRRILGSMECGPFDTAIDLARWLTRVLRG